MLITDMEIFLYGLAYECPYKRREQDCPFREIESLSFKEKAETIDEWDLLRKEAAW
jgi:hypothetical protein